MIVFPNFPQTKKNVAFSGSFESMKYKKDPKDRSLAGFSLIAILLGLLAFMVCNTIVVHTCSVDSALSILDWEQKYFWATILIVFAMGLSINGIAWSVFMIKASISKK